MRMPIPAVLVLAAAGLAGAAPERAYDAENSYVVIMTAETAAKQDWRRAGDILRKKYDADLIVCSDSPEDSLPALSRIRPNYVCFVLQPSEAGRKTVVAIHRFMRRLDDDPYTDALWGILTGYDAADAARLAQHTEPLVIDSAASSMGPGEFKHLTSGFASSEADKSRFWIKLPGQAMEARTVEPDAVRHLVQALNEHPPDMFVTSGHATEEDWQVGYNIRAGSFRHEEGQLFGRDTRGKRYDINSPAPKVYLPYGNCLIGHIPRQDCMATAWIHTGGAIQMFGYVAVTFHGYMGWGIGKYLSHADCTLAEAFFFNNQALVQDLRMRYPDHAGRVIEPLERSTLQRMAREQGIRDHKLLGHLWDKDAVAFYGDPAWIAKRQDRGRLYTWSVQRKAEAVHIAIDVLRDARCDRPFIVPLRERVASVKPGACSADVAPVFADNFVLLPVQGTAVQAGDRITITFGAKPLRRHATSARSAPIRAPATGDETDTAQRRTGDEATARAPLSARARTALRAAGPNAGSIREALDRAAGHPWKQRCMRFLVENMPLVDLQSLKSEFLINTVDYALQAREKTPWGKTLSDEIFLSQVLPYASLNERRDNWRPDFYARFMPLVADCKSAGEAAIKLNTTIYDRLNVQLREAADYRRREVVAAILVTLEARRAQWNNTVRQQIGDRSVSRDWVG